MTLTGAYGVQGVTGMAYFGHVSLISSDAFVKYDLKTETIETRGKIRLVALLILQEAKKMKEQQSYSYDGVSYTPEYISWGPFNFHSTTYQATIRPLNREEYHETEKVVSEILHEINNSLQDMKAFW